jgi:hypothetical protein
MVEYYFEKLGGKLSKESIKVVYEMLETIKKHIPYKDFEEVISNYLNLEVLKKEHMLDKMEIEMNLKNIRKSQYNIINQSIIDKRNNNTLIEYLRKLDDKELMLINELVDLGSEFKIVNDEKYVEMKKRRRSKSHKSISLGGNYDINQKL